MKEIIQHKKNGYLAKPYSVEDFEKGIKYVLSNKKNPYMIRAEVLKNYLYKQINKNYQIFLKKIINEN